MVEIIGDCGYIIIKELLEWYQYIGFFSINKQDIVDVLAPKWVSK